MTCLYLSMLVARQQVASKKKGKAKHDAVAAQAVCPLTSSLHCITASLNNVFQ